MPVDYIATDGLTVLIYTICMLSVPALLDLLAMHINNRLGRRKKKRPAGVASTYEAVEPTEK